MLICRYHRCPNSTVQIHECITFHLFWIWILHCISGPHFVHNTIFNVRTFNTYTYTCITKKHEVAVFINFNFAKMQTKNKFAAKGNQIRIYIQIQSRTTPSHSNYYSCIFIFFFFSFSILWYFLISFASQIWNGHNFYYIFCIHLLSYVVWVCFNHIFGHLIHHHNIICCFACAMCIVHKAKEQEKRKIYHTKINITKKMSDGWKKNLKIEMIRKSVRIICYGLKNTGVFIHS